MWTAYLRHAGLPADTALPPVWHFCDNQVDADVCAALVRSGEKRATAPSLWGLQHRDEPVPAVGSLNIVTTWDGEASSIIRTTRVEIVPFAEVSADHAREEGEGDRSLASWRVTHAAYYARELAGTGHQVSAEMPIVCERFEVVFP
jgi:uncharacterized protein YhfF